MISSMPFLTITTFSPSDLTPLFYTHLSQNRKKVDQWMLLFVIYSTLLATLCLPTYAHSESTKDHKLTNTNSDHTLPLEIIITASRHPEHSTRSLPTTEVITRQEIERDRIQDTVALLRRINGLNVIRSGAKGSPTGISLRGTSTAQTLILVDGVRLNTASSGNSSLEAIPIESIERVEVVKGPLSSLYGSNAIGGVIQIFTRRGDDTNAGAQISAFGGTHDTERYHVSTQIGGQKGHAYLDTTHEFSKGFNAIESFTNTNIDSDPYKQNTGHLSTVYFPTEDIRHEVNYVYSDSDTDFDNSPTDQFDARTHTHVETASTQFTGKLNTLITWQAGLGFSKDHSHTNTVFSKGAVQNRTRTYHANTTLTPTSTLNGQAGIEYTTDYVTVSGDSLPYNNDERKNRGIFSHWAWSHGRFHFAMGGRIDDDSAFGKHKTGSTALDLHLQEHTRATLSYGTAFRAPTFNDLYYPGFSNPELQPETSRSTELALRHDSSDFSWHFSLYQTHLRDLITFDTAQLKPINKSRAKIEGVELSFSTALPLNTQWQTNVAYTDARDEVTDTRLNFRPTATITSTASWQYKRLNWGLDAEVIRGRRLLGERTPTYGLLGTHVNYQPNQYLTLTAKAENLGDRDYVENRFFDGSPYGTPGRTYVLGFTLDLL